jgi:hypothetical protein
VQLKINIWRNLNSHSKNGNSEYCNIYSFEDFDKGYDFNFPIVNFLFICSNISTAPAYGVSLSWCDIPALVVPSMISLIKGCWQQARKLLNQEFLVVKLKSYHRYHDFVNRFGISELQMTTWYVLPVVITIRFFPHSWLITG